MSSSTIQTLLVVCAGNICRSPVAEALFRQRLARRAPLRQVTVSSAGTIALPGNRAAERAVWVASDLFGLDLTTHRARRFSAALPADLVLTVDRYTTDQAIALGATAPVMMLGDFVGLGEEVEDPYGGPDAGYVRSAHQLDRLVDAALARLEAQARGTRSGLSDPPGPTDACR